MPPHDHFKSSKARELVFDYLEFVENEMKLPADSEKKTRFLELHTSMIDMMGDRQWKRKR